jgi:hypothetical protein
MNASHALRTIGLAMVACSIMAVGSAHAREVASKAKAAEDWQVRGDGNVLMTNTPYALLNMTCGQYLSIKYKGSSGLDQVPTWDAEYKRPQPAKRRIQIVRMPRDNAPSPLKYGDMVAITMPESAIYQGKPIATYLMYTKQATGINLGWLKGGSAQWVIEGGPKGTPVSAKAKFSLYNIVAKDSVVYAERDNGINLRWNKEVNPPRDHRK